MEIVTQSVGEHDHQVPLQMRKHRAIEQIKFKNWKLRFKKSPHETFANPERFIRHKMVIYKCNDGKDISLGVTLDP